MSLTSDNSGYDQDYNGASVMEADKKIPIIELFGPTIQGEGFLIGTQVHFIRFGGCDYRCQMCDSLHAVLPDNEHFKNAPRLTNQEIAVRLLDQMRTEWVVFSGGNPCIWELSELVDLLHTNDPKKKIMIETQGTIWRDWIKQCDHITVSPKGPGMGAPFEEDVFSDFMTRLVHGKCDYSIKVVTFCDGDLQLAERIANGWPHLVDQGRFFLSVGNHLPPAPNIHGNELDQIAEEHRHAFVAGKCLQHYRKAIEAVQKRPALQGARILPQMHVLLWGNERAR